MEEDNFSIDTVVTIALNILNKGMNYDLIDSCMLELRLSEVFEKGFTDLEVGYKLFSDILDEKFTSLNDIERAYSCCN